VLLSASETELSRCKREPWHFFAGFLPQRSLVKLRQLLQLLLGELLGIDRNQFTFEAVPMEIFRQKALHDVPVGSELRILNVRVIEEMVDLTMALFAKFWVNGNQDELILLHT
jgi:hypothetical protein